MNNDSLLTVNEAAKCLVVHPITIHRMLTDGRLRGFQLQKWGRWRIYASSIEALKKQYSNEKGVSSA